MKFASAFTGIAGFEAGFAKHGITTTTMIEVEKNRHPCLKEHFPDVNLMEDIHDVTGTDLGTIDGIVGGFPCKGITRAAADRGGIHDDRSKSFFEFVRLADEYIRLVDATNPRWWVMENSADLIGFNNGRDLATVLRHMVELGYGWAFRVVDARDFGTNQLRKRIIVVGHLGGDPRPAGMVLGLTDARGSTPEQGPGGFEKSGPHSGPMPLGGDLVRVWRKGARPRVSISHVWKGPNKCAPNCQRPHGYAEGYRETWVDDGRANTLTANDFGGPTRQVHLVSQGGRLRTLTLLEHERLQGFDDHWTAAMVKTARGDALGNAIPVGMSSWVGSGIVDVHHSLPQLVTT